MSVLHIAPKVYVDWENNGDFADANEDVSADVVAVNWKRGRTSINDNFGMGTARVTLENTSDKYSPFDTSSALDGKMIPGRLVKIEANHNSIDYPIFYGRLSGVRQRRTPRGAPLVDLSLEDDFGRLSRSRFRADEATYQAGGLISTLISEVLTDAGYAAGDKSLETSLVTLDTWSFYNGSFLEALQSLAHDELAGAFFIGADGKAVFHNREHNTLEAVGSTWAGVQSLEITTRQRDFIDEVIHKRAGLDISTDVEAIYQLFPTGRELGLDTDEALNTIHGEYISSAKNVVTPVMTTDYTANAMADGSGEDLTEKIAVDSFTSYGGGFSLTFDNMSGQTAYLTKLVIRGDPVRVSDETREISVTDSGAPVTGQALRDEFDFNDDASSIRGYALFRLHAGTAHYPRRVRARLIPQSDAEAVSLLGMELQDRATLTNTSGLYDTTLNAEFLVQNINGKWIKGGLVEYDIDFWHEIAALGTFFRISGGTSYSAIVSSSASAGDAIRF